MSSNINNDRIELLEKLEKSTHLGRIKWSRLEADSLVFIHETQSNVIEFTKGLNNELDELFVVRVRNNEGKVVVSFNDEDIGISGVFELFENLYNFIADSTSPEKETLRQLIDELDDDLLF